MAVTKQLQNHLAHVVMQQLSYGWAEHQEHQDMLALDHAIPRCDRSESCSLFLPGQARLNQQAHREHSLQQTCQKCMQQGTNLHQHDDGVDVAFDASSSGRILSHQSA
eukprot:364743-Chlamydomonas_euryale.AAC.70